MTGRSRWLVLLGMAGLGLGLLRNQQMLSWLSLTVLVWLFYEWLNFHIRLLREFPQVRIYRSVNGRTQSNGYLWAGRHVTVEVTVETKSVDIAPMLVIRDILPENMQVTEGRCQFEVLTAGRKFHFRYRTKVGGAGRIELPGFRLTIQDAQQFFAVERFVQVPQAFRVLPAYADLNESQTLVKRINSLPQHGIHRLQRAGMGSELLELREYVPGDPPKSIAWKVSARRDTLMTRQYESEVPVRLYLFVDGSIGTRLGGYGQRLLDQMLFVAGTIARSSVSVGDPVGAVLFDERGRTRITPTGGERGFYKLLEALSDFSVNPDPPPQRLTPQLQRAALRLAGERFPELLDPRVNQVPFTFFPLMPWNRRDRYQRTLLANLLAEMYDLPPDDLIALVHDDSRMASAAQRFLAEGGVSWMDPLVQTRGRGFHNGMATMELFSKAISEAVSAAKDNEVYVVMANLIECATNISYVLPAVKMALARHHRVIFVCPTATFRRPGQLADDNSSAQLDADHLLERAEDLRQQELTARLKRALRRVGASVAVSGENEAIRLVLAETNLARSGRVSTAGVR